MKRKVAGFGLAFSLAELAAAYLPPLALLLTAAVFAVFYLFALPRLRSGGKRRYTAAVLGLVAGLAWAFGYQTAVSAPRRALAGRTADCVAVIETDCENSYQDGRLRGTLRLVEIDGKRTDVKVYCMNFPGVEPGERFAARLSLSELEEDAYRLGRYAKGTYLMAEYTGGYELLGEQNAPRFALYRIRMALSRKLRSYLPRTLGGIEAAMLVGDKSRLNDRVEDTFRTAGVSHLLAISGLHLTMLCGLFVLGKDNKWRFYRPYLLLQAGVLLFYMALTGFSVSILRAGIIFLISLLGYALLQPPDLLTSLGMAAVLIGLPNAYAPCDIGFQLSFAGVIGVQLGAVLFEWEHKKLLPYREDDPAPLRTLAISLALKPVETVQTALLATAATLPILLANGLAASGVAVLTNLLVVWMLPAALVLGLAVLLLAALPFLAPCMHMASFLLAVWLKWMYGLIGWCAALPAAHIYLPPRYTLLVLAVLGLLALAFYKVGRMPFYLPAAALCIGLAVGLGRRMQRDVIRLALVGTAGNACLVAVQNNAAAVFFRGGASNLNAVNRWLAENGAPEWVVTVDLRQEPGPVAFPAEACYTLEEMATDTVPLTGSLTADLFHTAKGNLAVLDAGGYHVAMAAGGMSLRQPVEVDLLCAAGSLPQGIDAGVILTNTAAPRWLENAPEDARILYGAETPGLTIRPGRSARFEEVRQLAVQ